MREKMKLWGLDDVGRGKLSIFLLYNSNYRSHYAILCLRDKIQQSFHVFLAFGAHKRRWEMSESFASSQDENRGILQINTKSSDNPRQ